MSYETLISARALRQHLEDPDWALVDCRFSLGDVERGYRDYIAGHIPGAVYASIETDLSGPIRKGVTGRHPLPSPVDQAKRFSEWGIGPGVQVIAYDDAGGAMAARLWWLLRWLGHEAVAVLDGGWPAWRASGGPIRSGAERRSPRVFTARERAHLVASAADVALARPGAEAPVLDSRGADRYRGENETLDPVAGHIPGALSAPFAGNLGPDGLFLSPEALRARFLQLLDGADSGAAIYYCGSGVTAAHNLLALAHAGLGDARLYAGSWSEWITDPARPVAVGDRP